MSKILLKEELSWFQRSRVKWLIDGDINIHYYHEKDVKKRRKNKVKMIRDEDEA